MTIKSAKAAAAAIPAPQSESAINQPSQTGRALRSGFRGRLSESVGGGGLVLKNIGTIVNCLSIIKLMPMSQDVQASAATFAARQILGNTRHLGQTYKTSAFDNTGSFKNKKIVKIQ